MGEGKAPPTHHEPEARQEGTLGQCSGRTGQHTLSRSCIPKLGQYEVQAQAVQAQAVQAQAVQMQAVAQAAAQAVQAQAVQKRGVVLPNLSLQSMAIDMKGRWTEYRDPKGERETSRLQIAWLPPCKVRPGQGSCLLAPRLGRNCCYFT